MLFTNSTTGFPMADPHKDLLAGPLPPRQELENAFRTMIIGTSGWRKVFAASGDEEDDTPGISRADAFLAALAAQAFIRECHPSSVIVGIDSRPTGNAIADIVCRILLANGVAVRYLFISAAPEIMAYSAKRTDDHFFYISASHNPIGHNGFKFGRDGGVFASKTAMAVIAAFRTLVTDPESLAHMQRLSASVATDAYESVLRAVDREKERALLAYEHLVLVTATGSEDELAYGDMVAAVRHDLERNPIGIVGELNGSARGTTIDRQFLSGLGVRVRYINEKPRRIVHPIVPEGENLELCRKELEKAYAGDPSFQLGYVPDNDGDRGNIVYYDDASSCARILGAQQLFALVSLIELTLSQREGVPQAIAVNGPTSLMVDIIAERLGVLVVRAEVGEANVVRLGEQLRRQGYAVRVLGEGSNGGNITHPSKVRDPLNTLVSLIKLLSSGERFTRVTGIKLPSATHPTIRAALESLPKRSITGSFSREATMRIATPSHGELKAAYEKLFLLSYAQRSSELLSRFGIHSWREEQTEGTMMHVGMGPGFRTEPMRGGLKIVFMDRNHRDTDFIWMRGSGTEPVFRIMADALGDDRTRHDYLLDWQRSLVQEADQAAGARHRTNGNF